MLYEIFPQPRDGYYREDIPKTLVSSSVFNPDSPPRITQSNVGWYLAKIKDRAEDSYGVHKSKYGGTGEVHVPTEGVVNIAPRKINHWRTGLDQEPEVEIDARCRARRVRDNYFLYGHPVQSVGPLVFEGSKELKANPLPQLHQKQLFPRSIVYEISYVKEMYRQKMIEAIEKERALLEQKTKETMKITQMKSATDKDEGVCSEGEGIAMECTRPKTTMDKTPKAHTPDSWEPKPPFWYKGGTEGGEKEEPWVGHPDDYTRRNPGVEEVEKKDWWAELGLDQLENYIPGQVYKEDTTKQPLIKRGYAQTAQDLDDKGRTLPLKMERGGLCQTKPPGGEMKECRDDVVPLCASVCTICGCSLGEYPCNKCQKVPERLLSVKERETIGWNGNKCKEFPNQQPKYVKPWNNERRAELLRVGYPFATEAAEWLHNTVPPFNVADSFRPSKKFFPEIGLPTIVL